MTVLRSLLVATSLGSALGLGCYSEQLPPSNYRYACEADADCNGNEVCRRGLCERPCTQLTASEDCPFEEGYAACFNGVCATTCAVGSNYCPAVYECIDLGIEAGSSSPFGGSSDPVGICGLQCDDAENADLCPEGEICISGFGLGACVVDCSDGQECPSGYTCFFGLCAPEGSEFGTTGDGGAAQPDDGEVLR
ncbi:MAG: hypothetical protein KDK70_18285 [Myxococcales bacterium]|nr:hypothetical protein [Myxococcales bacterium]